MRCGNEMMTVTGPVKFQANGLTNMPSVVSSAKWKNGMVWPDKMKTKSFYLSPSVTPLEIKRALNTTGVIRRLIRLLRGCRQATLFLTGKVMERSDSGRPCQSVSFYLPTQKPRACPRAPCADSKRYPPFLSLQGPPLEGFGKEGREILTYLSINVRNDGTV